MKKVIFSTAILSVLLSCGQDENKKNELELKERELALKEKEFVMKEKDTTAQKQLVSPEPVIVKNDFPNFQSFYIAFKLAVAENNMQKLSEYVEFPSEMGYKNKYDFIRNFKFSNNVKRVIKNTSLPKKNEGEPGYAIDDMDDQLIFILNFKQNKNKQWRWSIVYAD